jgi:hypothetical protein
VRRATIAYEPLFNGVPSFFRACVREAQNRTNGSDYESAGWHFADLLSETGDDEEKAAELDRIIVARGDEQLLAFLRREYPRCLALVPPRRREKFIAGVWRAIDEGRGR